MSLMLGNQVSSIKHISAFKMGHARVVQISQVLIYTKIYDSTNGLYEADI